MFWFPTGLKPSGLRWSSWPSLTVVDTDFESPHRVLTGINVDSLEAGAKALSKLHDYGARFVTVTSSSLKGQDDGDHLSLLGSYRHKDGSASDQRFIIQCPKLPAYFTGTGDLFAALVLAHLGRQLPQKSTKGEAQAFRKACEIAVSVIQAVLKRTMDYYIETGDKGNMSEDLKVKCTELRLIQSKDLLQSEAVTFQSKDWPN